MPQPSRRHSICCLHHNRKRGRQYWGDDSTLRESTGPHLVLHDRVHSHDSDLVHSEFSSHEASRDCFATWTLRSHCSPVGSHSLGTSYFVRRALLRSIARQ